MSGAADSSGGGSAALDAAMMEGARSLVPPLTASSHKGMHGKVGVVGGCREYTGAPYFAGISAVRVGADLSHVFCTPGAAPVIKSYSPELIVLPFLPDDPGVAGQLHPEPAAYQIRGWLSRLTCLVVGPGLGDDDSVVAVSKMVVEMARKDGLPLLVDGSGLNFVAEHPDLVRGYDKCILTPNLPEFGRLAAGVGLKLNGSIGPQWQQQTQQLAAALDGPIVVSKGPVDVISDGATTVECALPSSLRRAGGQGDVVAGSISAFLCWAFPRRPAGGGGGGGGDGRRALMHAAYGGCAVVRAASARSFAERRRSMLAGDIIPHLQGAFEELFPDA